MQRVPLGADVAPPPLRGPYLPPVHLYFHVPFCARRCSYCDFAIAVRRETPSAAYAEAVLAEWGGRQAEDIWQASPLVETVYFGGGTPSRLAPEALARIVDRIGADHPLAPDAEITLEANPDDVTPEHAAAWRAAGVNRVSLGVQSFDPGVLAWMHRTHTVQQVPAAMAALRSAGIENLSLDLIFGLPAELSRDWTADLDRAFALEPEHLSLYGLTVEDHTPLARWVAGGRVQPVAEERYADEFLAAAAAIRAAGFEHYEVSNAARSGHRARHNSAYWRGAPYLGLGPSAHSLVAGERRWNLRDWAAYQRAIEAGGDIVAGRELLDLAARRLEAIYLGLRTIDGVPADRLPATLIDRWIAEGWAELAAPWPGPPVALPSACPPVRLTPEGWLRLDALVAAT